MKKYKKYLLNLKESFINLIRNKTEKCEKYLLDLKKSLNDYLENKMKKQERNLLGLIISFIAIMGIANGYNFIQVGKKKDYKLLQDSLIQSRMVEGIISINKKDSLTLQFLNALINQSKEKTDSTFNYLRQIKDEVNDTSKELLLREILEVYKDVELLDRATFLQLQELNKQMNIFITTKKEK